MVNCGTITVEPAFDPSLVTFSCSASGTVTVGDTEDIEIVVTNENDNRATYSIDVLLNGTVETFRNGIVSGNSTSEETVTVQFESPGEVDVSLSATVEEP